MQAKGGKELCPFPIFHTPDVLTDDFTVLLASSGICHSSSRWHLKGQTSSQGELGIHLALLEGALCATPNLTPRVQKKDVLMFLKMFSSQSLRVLSRSYLSSLKDGLGSKGVVQSTMSIGPQCHSPWPPFLSAFSMEEVLCGSRTCPKPHCSGASMHPILSSPKS